MRRQLFFYALLLAAVMAAFAGGPMAPSGASEKTVYVSPQTTDPLLVSYQVAFRKRVAAAGESNFTRVNGEPIHGNALLAVTISRMGTVEAVDVIQSSTEEIAAHSEQLIRALQPYAPFSTELRGRAARVVLMARLNYAK